MRSLFQSHWCTGVRKEADEVMHTSWQVMFVSFLIARSDSKMTMPGFVMLIL